MGAARNGGPLCPGGRGSGGRGTFFSLEEKEFMIELAYLGASMIEEKSLPTPVWLSIY